MRVSREGLRRAFRKGLDRLFEGSPVNGKNRLSGMDSFRVISMAAEDSSGGAGADGGIFIQYGLPQACFRVGTDGLFEQITELCQAIFDAGVEAGGVLVIYFFQDIFGQVKTLCFCI